MLEAEQMESTTRIEPTIAYAIGRQNVHKKAAPLAGKRAPVYASICADPGQSFLGLVNAFNMGRGEAQYHLLFLERAGLVKTLRLGRFRRYFPTSHAASALAVAVLKTPGIGDVLRHILANPGTHQTPIWQKMQVNHESVRYHVKRLVGLGLVRVEERGKFTHLYPTQQAVGA